MSVYSIFTSVVLVTILDHLAFGFANNVISEERSQMSGCIPVCVDVGHSYKKIRKGLHCPGKCDILICNKSSIGYTAKSVSESGSCVGRDLTVNVISIFLCNPGA